MPDYLFVDQPDTLTKHLNGHARLGVDTEFMREKTYFAQLCLIQIAANETIYCVDPLGESVQQEFWRTLFAKNWVLHSARQDIEVVYQTAGAMPTQIFDTQVAAGLLGMPPQLGYAGLVKELFEIDIAKSHTRADWTRRPLPEAVLDYAAEDVEHLLPAADALMESLDKKGRLSWAEEDSMLLLDPDLYATTDNQAIDRLKGARNFRGRKRATAARLAAWREAEAIRRNRPRQWILRDNVLLDIAFRMPDSLTALSKIQGMPAKLVSRAGKDIVGTVAASREDDNDYQPPRPPDEQQKALLREMQSKVAECAKALDLAAETIASKRELSAVIISGDHESRVFTGWRRDLIGEELLGLL